MSTYQGDGNIFGKQNPQSEPKAREPIAQNVTLDAEWENNSRSNLTFGPSAQRIPLRVEFSKARIIVRTEDDKKALREKLKSDSILTFEPTKKSERKLDFKLLDEDLKSFFNIAPQGYFYF